MASEKNSTQKNKMIYVSSDYMSAVLNISLPQEDVIVTFEDVMAAVNEAGIKTGIDEELIKNILLEKRYGERIEIAKGKPVQDGVDGYFTFHYDPIKKENSPHIKEDGSVSYINTEEFLIVKKGDLLATYTRGTPGVYGYTIQSKVLPPKRGKELPRLKGRGFDVINEGTQYIANIDGKLDIGDNSMNISPILEVTSNVDVTTGHIDFIGDIIIRGDVTSGMKVTSGGNITIYGHVGASLIIAGKDIVIKQGMQGKEKGRIEAGGMVQGTFFEKSYIKAQEGIVANSIMDCYIESLGLVKAIGRQGLLLGGKICAVEGIEAKTVGNDAEAPTLLCVGVTKETRSKIPVVLEIIKKVQDEISLLDKSARMFERMEKTKLTKEIEARKIKITKAKVIKEAELKGYIKDYNQINTEITLGRGATVLVRGLVYPGTVVELNGEKYSVQEIAKDVVFRITGTEVIMEGNR